MSFATTSVLRHATAQMRMDSPLGPILLVRTAEGLAGAWFEDQKHHPGAIGAPEVADDPVLSRAAAQLTAYFDGAADTAFDVPLDLQGSDFQRGVWAELLRIGAGRTCSYGDIARAIGAPQAVRAVGSAVGRNPVSVIVPCHRVVGSGGALTGYAGGLDRKRALLALEGQAGRPDAAAAQADLPLEARA
jgi:methylated-DNA-[protein]-cysteine S-methyltransferase